MNAEFRRVKEIFLAAVEIPDAAERDAYVRDACGQDEELRRQVDALLGKHAQAGSFLESPALGAVATVDEAGREQSGTAIGPYKLIEQIGEGGMGTVWMAQQTEPVKRLVAVKLIKAGMDSKQVIARFEAERQALALMDHPNIARVLDGGTSRAGRPYFVMDLVKGVPITKYCDEHHLTRRQRLELFAPVCQAIQHAHQKGIIHRDLKPSNVLVAHYDGKPVPKVIDFGVAKAAGQQLTDKTLVTGFGNVVGTLEYMSPEQAETNQLDIDTRSDIYSLGVLLYELLAGSPPFSKKDLEKTSMLEMLRVIREQEPSKPSTKLSTAEGLLTLAANRGTEPAKLTKLVRGELDWIVMKALEKDRNRRYETANGFAMDVQRYLADEPVLACPPSIGYRLRKFARRNKAGLATAGLVLFFIVLLGGAVGWAVRDRAAREEQLAQERITRQARVTGQLELILDEVAKLEQAEKWAEALASVRRAEPALATGEAAPETQQRVRETLVDLKLVQRLDEIRMSSGTPWSDSPLRQKLSAQADREYGAALREAGIDVDAPPVQQAAERITSRRAIAEALLPALDDWVAVRSVGNDEAAARRLSDVLHSADRDPWRQRLRDALVRKDWPALENLVTSVELERQPAATLSFLSAALRANGKSLMEERVLRRAQWSYPADFWINHRLGINLIWQQSPNRVLEGIGYMRAAVAVRPQSAHSVMNLGNGYLHLGQHDQAIACFRKAIELVPYYSGSYYNLGIALGEKGLHEEAIAAFHHAIELNPKQADPHRCLGEALARQGKLDQAITCCKKAIELDPNHTPAHHALGCALKAQNDLPGAVAAFKQAIALAPEYPWSHSKLGAVLEAQGKVDEAIAAQGEAVRLLPDNAIVNHKLAWLLATRAEARFRDPKRAVELATKAVQLEPKNPLYWQTLGHAEYRAGNWKSAITALEKVKELGSLGDSVGWFPMAMAHWQMGNKEAARKWYHQAVEWMEKHQPKNEELRRFRAEAAELLGVKEKKD